MVFVGGFQKILAERAQQSLSVALPVSTYLVVAHGLNPPAPTVNNDTPYILSSAIYLFHFFFATYNDNMYTYVYVIC